MAAHTPEPCGGRVERGLRTVRGLVDDGTAKRVLKWFTAGLAFMGINTVFLFVLVGIFSLSIPVATFLAAEGCTLLRFFVNHYWVFGRKNPTLKECFEYHIANAGAFAVWWATANVLTLLGMHYLVAGVLAVGCSTLVSLASNFLWIWSKHRVIDGTDKPL